MFEAENEKKREALWAELLDAMDRDDGEAFRAALGKRKLPIDGEWSREDSRSYAVHFAVTHSLEDGKTLVRIMEAIHKYCPGEYEQTGKVAPLSHWDLNW